MEQEKQQNDNPVILTESQKIQQEYAESCMRLGDLIFKMERMEKDFAKEHSRMNDEIKEQKEKQDYIQRKFNKSLSKEKVPLPQ